MSYNFPWLSVAPLRDELENKSGIFFILEVNTQPGMTPTSLVPEIAKFNGISFDELINWILNDASTNR